MNPFSRTSISVFAGQVLACPAFAVPVPGSSTIQYNPPSYTVQGKPGPTGGLYPNESYPLIITGPSAASASNPLTITADNKTMMVGGPLPTLTASYSGLVNGDAATVVSGVTLGTTATAASPVGTYPITVSGGTAANYTIARVDGTLTVKIAISEITGSGSSRPILYSYATGSPNLPTYTIDGNFKYQLNFPTGQDVHHYLIEVYRFPGGGTNDPQLVGEKHVFTR